MQAFHENMDKKIKEAYPDAQTNLDLSYEISAHGVQKSTERIKELKTYSCSFRQRRSWKINHGCKSSISFERRGSKCSYFRC